MPIVLTCPNGHTLQVADEHAGKQAMCAVCQALILIPAPGRPVAPPVYQPERTELAPITLTGIKEPEPPRVADLNPGSAPMEITEITGGAETFRIQDGDSPAFAQLVEPRARRRRPRERLNVQDRLQGLSVVNVGLGFHYARLLVYLVSILIWMATILIAGLSGAAQSGDTLGLLRFLEVVLIIGMLIVTPLLGLAGSILCLWVPGGSGARPWISLALALDTVLFPLAVVRTLAGLGPTAVLVLMSVSFLLILAAFVFFMIFLSTLAEYLDQPGLSQEAHHLLFKGIALPVAFLMLVVLLYALMHVSPQLFGIPGVILLIIWLVVYLNFLFELLNLISSLRQVLATRW